MAVLNILDSCEVFYDKAALPDGLSLNNVNVLAERIFAEDPKNKGGFFIGKRLLGPFGVHGKEIEQIGLSFVLGLWLVLAECFWRHAASQREYQPEADPPLEMEALKR